MKSKEAASGACGPSAFGASPFSYNSNQSFLAGTAGGSASNLTLNQSLSCSNPTLNYLEESIKLIKDSKGSLAKPGSASGAPINSLISQSLAEEAIADKIDTQALIEIYARKKGRKPNYLKALL